MTIGVAVGVGVLAANSVLDAAPRVYGLSVVEAQLMIDLWNQYAASLNDTFAALAAFATQYSSTGA